MIVRGRLLIVDDHPVVREGLAAMVDRQEDMEVVGFASDGMEAVEAYRRLLPDTVLMDLRLPLRDGLTATREILKDHPDARVVILTTFQERGLARRALAAGAKGVLLKDAGPDELLAAIRTAWAGDVTVHKTLASSLDVPDGMAGGELSAREVEILANVAEGMTNREIARSLFLTENTVKTHLANLFAKMGVHDRAGAVAEGVRRGLILNGVGGEIRPNG